MKKLFELELLDTKPISINKYQKQHWSKQAEEKEDLEHSVFYIAKQNRIESVSEYPITVKFIFVLCKKTRRDLDNMAVSCKYILDGLRKAGVILDDDINHINELNLKAHYGSQDKIIVQIFGK